MTVPEQAIVLFTHVMLVAIIVLILMGNTRDLFDTQVVQRNRLLNAPNPNDWEHMRIPRLGGDSRILQRDMMYYLWWCKFWILSVTLIEVFAIILFALDQKWTFVTSLVGKPATAFHEYFFVIANFLLVSLIIRGFWLKQKVVNFRDQAMRQPV
jgi:hypothetical protein